MRKVAVVVQDGVEAFGLGSICEVWAEPYHPEDDNPVFDFALVTPRPGRVRGSSGFDILVEHGLDRAADADLVCVAPKRSFRDPSPEVAELLRHADRRGALIFAHCTAAFTVGEAGLLDGRRCTTHWRYVDELAARHPSATVDRDVLYVQDGNLTTGAGSAAGIDAALHLYRQQFGAQQAAAAARRMVVAPHRTATAARHSSSRAPYPISRPRASGRCWRGPQGTWPRTSASTGWRGRPTCRRGPSRAASARRPAPRLTPG